MMKQGVKMEQQMNPLPEIISFEEEMRRFETGSSRDSSVGFGRSLSGTSLQDSFASPKLKSSAEVPLNESGTDTLEASLEEDNTTDEFSLSLSSLPKTAGQVERIPTSKLLELYGNNTGKKKGKEVASRYKASVSTAPAGKSDGNVSPSDNHDLGEATKYMVDYRTSRESHGWGTHSRRMYPKLQIPFLNDDTRQIYFNSARACTNNSFQTLLSYRRSGVSHTRDGARILPQSSMGFDPHSPSQSPEPRRRQHAQSRSRSDLLSQFRAHTSMGSHHDRSHRPLSRVQGQQMSVSDELPQLASTHRMSLPADGSQYPGEAETLVLRRHRASLRHPETYMSWLTSAITVLSEVPGGKGREGKGVREMRALSHAALLHVRGLLIDVRTQQSHYQGLTHQFGCLYGQRKAELAVLRQQLVGGGGGEGEAATVSAERHAVRVSEMMICRFTARFNGLVKQSISRFWHVLPKNQHRGIAHKDFLRLHFKFFRALLPACDPEYARRAANLDWQVDLGGQGGDGSVGLRQGAFTNSMFELADNWCEGQGAEELVTFLNKLLVAVVDDSGHLRDESEIFHDERFWFDGVDPLREANRWDFARIEAQGPRNTFFHGSLLSQSQPVLKRADEFRTVVEAKGQVGQERSGEDAEMADVRHLLERDARLLTPETMAVELKELAHMHLPKYTQPSTPQAIADKGTTVRDVLERTEKLAESYRPSYQGMDALQTEHLSLAQLRELQALVHARVPTPSDLIGLRLKLETINIAEFGKPSKAAQDVFPKPQESWPARAKPTNADVARFQEAKKRLQLEKELRSRNSRFLNLPSSKRDQRKLKSFTERQEEKEQQRRMQGFEEFKRRKAQRIKASKKLHAEDEEEEETRTDDRLAHLPSSSGLWPSDKTGNATEVWAADEQDDEEENLEESNELIASHNDGGDNQEADGGIFSRLERVAHRRRASVESNESQELEETAALNRILRSAEGSRQGSKPTAAVIDPKFSTPSTSLPNAPAPSASLRSTGDNRRAVKPFVSARERGSAKKVTGTSPYPSPLPAQVRRLPAKLPPGSPDLDNWQTAGDTQHVPPLPLTEPPPSTPPAMRSAQL